MAQVAAHDEIADWYENEVSRILRPGGVFVHIGVHP